MVLYGMGFQQSGDATSSDIYSTAAGSALDKLRNSCTLSEGNTKRSRVVLLLVFMVSAADMHARNDPECRLVRSIHVHE